MFAPLLALTCMYGVLIVLTLAMLVFTVRRTYLDFYPEEITNGVGNYDTSGVDSDKMHASKDDAHSSDTHQSGSSDTRSNLSPRARSQSSSKSAAKWAASEIDSVMCGLNRWGYFVFTTDSAIITCCLCTFASAVIIFLMNLSVIPCYPSGPTAASTYQISKGSMYFLFFNRVDNIFSDTPFAYSKLVIRSLMIFNFCVSLCLSIATVVFIATDSVKSGGLTQCKPVMPPLLGLFIITMDILMSGISMNMFISPLKKIYAMELESEMNSVPSVSPAGGTEMWVAAKQSSKKQLRSTSQVRKIAMKCRLLTCTAVASTMTMWVFAVFLSVADFVIWDMIINNLSVIFMTTWLDQYYHSVCCLPLLLESSLKKACSSLKR